MDGPRLNLLYISHGHTTHDRRFLRAFAEAGYRVSHLRWRGERPDRDEALQGVRVLGWPGDRRPLKTPLDFFLRCLALRRVIAEVRPQVIMAGPVQDCAFAVAWAGFKKLVAMSWGSDLLAVAGRTLWTRSVTKYALSRSAGAFGDCQAVRERIQAYSSLADGQIVTFPWGIDLSRFSSRASSLPLRRDLAWVGHPVVISTRTWEPIYAIDVLIRAFAMVLRDHPQTRLLLLGTGSQEPVVRGLISSLGLEHAVHAPGRMDQERLPEYLCLADVYVSSALSDGTSVSLLEAMACGLPVVVTRCPGNLEWIEDRKNGWLAVPGDPSSLAAALKEALADPARPFRAARENLELVRNRADWGKNVPQLFRLLERVACT
jgi:glycosyltransferase involved in cell wall biosynthesis